jgi:hypothetical protein
MQTQQNTTNKPLPQIDKATFKAVVYFKDGNVRTFYSFHTSYDAQEKKVFVNDKTALIKLTRLIERTYAGTYITALIYHKDTGRQMAKYCYGRLIQQTNVNFTYIKGAIRVEL